MQKKKKAVAPRVVKKEVIIEDENRETVPMIELGPRQCRWPIGDPQDKNFGFCGCEALPGLPYCLEHSKIAYQAATRNRILKSQEVRELEEVKKALSEAPNKKVSAA